MKAHCLAMANNKNEMMAVFVTGSEVRTEKKSADRHNALIDLDRFFNNISNREGSKTSKIIA